MLPTSGSVIDLSTRAKLRISGSDRLRYLNGQISNDLRKASASNAIYACVLSAKGKINADVFISTEGESYLLDTAPELREPLPARLERYIIADDVQVEDVTDEFALFHLIGIDPQALTQAGAKSRRAERFGCAGWDIWVATSEKDAVLQELRTQFAVTDEAGAETFRIEQGIPRWGKELTDEIIPTEANLEARAIDYAKGCYIGQEVISRIKMSGQTNKRLCGVWVESEALVETGTRLLTDDGKDVGWITSAVWSELLGKQIALGFVKRGFQEIGTVVTAGLPMPSRCEITALPFLD